MIDLLYYIFFIIPIIGVVLVIIADTGDSGRKLAWLLIIALIPLIGLFLYLAFGINYRKHWYFNKQHSKSIAAFNEGTNDKLNQLLFGKEDEEKIKEEFRPLASLIAASSHLTVSGNNSIEIITSGSRKFELLIEDISKAEKFIHIEYFHFGNDSGGEKIRSLLMKKASEGVKVFFIYENIANFPIRSSYYNYMRRAGVNVHSFTNPRRHPLNLITKINYRNHRKIVVIDGKIGYTGGMNINNRYFNIWRDTHMRITGPAVASLQYIFLDSWITSGGKLENELLSYYPMINPEKSPIELSSAEEKNTHTVLHNKLVQILPDEPDGVWPMIKISYIWVLSNAKNYIYLQTPYFVPPESLLIALKSAALRGVDVRLMLPEKTDTFFMRPANCSYYEECLEAGVRIFLRKGGFIHSKTFVADDYLSSIGTANLDFRSFDINYEVNTYIYDSETAIMNKEIFLNDMKSSYEITFNEWQNRPWTKKFLEKIIRLFSPLL